MKKIITIISAFLLSTVFLTGCFFESGNSEKDTSTYVPVTKTYINCSIEFSKSIAENKDNLYNEKSLPINTDIYVHVDFTFYNLDSNNDVIDFKVDLKPGFDTYNVYDFTKGPQEPTEPKHEEQLIDEDGIKKVIEISGMKFSLKSENSKKHYHYVFRIQASKTCDDCEFKAIFSPQDGNFNSGRNKSFSEKFLLVESSKEGV